jgi:20S proteasome alpha/beta subunit
MTVMAVNDGIIMAADRQAGCPAGASASEKIVYSKVMSRSVNKLFAIGDNIGLSSAGMTYPEMGLYFEFLSRTHSFNSPVEAANDIVRFIANVIKPTGGEKMHTVVFAAGYDKNKKDFRAKPEVYSISTIGGEAAVAAVGSRGFTHIGSSGYFDPYQDRINSNRVNYSLQDAADICKLAFDMSRSLERYLDFADNISPDIDILAITPGGIRWVLKQDVKA